MVYNGNRRNFMKQLTEVYTLYNGIKIPKVGYVTWQIPNSEA